MNDMKRDLIRIQELVGMAFSETGSLVALTDGGQMNPNKLQKTLEQTMEQFERTTLELRRLCERYSPGAGGFAHRPALPYIISNYDQSKVAWQLGLNTYVIGGQISENEAKEIIDSIT